uniref:Respiratory burst oxidase homolog protein C n=1 Tax=Rhizophora mucronata TaxID=61149 RepID=A0A2P2KVX2_RHIMU
MVACSRFRDIKPCALPSYSLAEGSTQRTTVRKASNKFCLRGELLIFSAHFLYLGAWIQNLLKPEACCNIQCYKASQDSGFSLALEDHEKENRKPPGGSQVLIPPWQTGGKIMIKQERLRKFSRQGLISDFV